MSKLVEEIEVIAETLSYGIFDDSLGIDQEKYFALVEDIKLVLMSSDATAVHNLYLSLGEVV